MELTCPACNKAAQSGDACARCGGELAPLRSLATAAALRLEAALAALEECDWPAATHHAQDSWKLRHSPAAARVAFLAAAAAGDASGARRWRALAQAAETAVPGHRR